jgi:pimeloyl-ACP methyl ester carboxylesterase
MNAAYTARRTAQSAFVPIRGLRYHVNTWGHPGLVTPDKPALLLLHGWMDVGASFQFVVDALAELEGPTRYILAPDWRGFGLTDTPGADTYWFPDYLADLDALLRDEGGTLGLAQGPSAQIDLLGHSMGGNVVMSYAGVRPARIRKLINLEGFGLPQTKPDQAPQRLLKWLNELQEPATLRSYDSEQAVAQRLLKNNPLLAPDKAAWLAPHWSRQEADGRWHILGHPAHKLSNPVLYQLPEILAAWAQIQAPLLWVEGAQTDMSQWWGQRYSHAEFETRLAVVKNVQRARLSPCGHMLHHDQPQALATHLLDFLRQP